MNIIIVGGGSVGKTVARDLIRQGQTVTIIDFETHESQNNTVEGAFWITGDACSPDIIKLAGGEDTDVLVAATGDDRVNLVSSMVSKTVFNIPKIIARINHPKNKYLFDNEWGVDYAISMPDAITDIIEDKVLEDEMIQIYRLNDAKKAIFKYHLGEDFQKKKVTKEQFMAENPDVTLLTVVRGEITIPVNENFLLEVGDELFVLGDISESL